MPASIRRCFVPPRRSIGAKLLAGISHASGDGLYRCIGNNEIESGLAGMSRADDANRGSFEVNHGVVR